MIELCRRRPSPARLRGRLGQLAEQFRGAVVHISFVWGAVRVEVGKGGHVDDLRRRREDALVEALEGIFFFFLRAMYNFIK